MSDLATRREGESLLIRVRVTPRASRTQVTGCVEGVLRVKVQAPPVEGAANEAVRVLIADRLRIPKSRVEVVRGETGREKTIRVEGVTEGDLKALRVP